MFIGGCPEIHCSLHDASGCTDWITENTYYYYKTTGKNILVLYHYLQ